MKSKIKNQKSKIKNEGRRPGLRIFDFCLLIFDFCFRQFRRQAPALALAVLILAAAAVAGPAPGIETERVYHSAGDKLICLCGCMQSVYGCNHYGCPQSDQLRKDLRAAIASTDSEQAAVDMMVQKYGDKILTEPPRKGFSLTAWVMPFTALAAGAILIIFILRAWHRTTQANAAAAAASHAQVDPALFNKYASKIDEDIEKE